MSIDVLQNKIKKSKSPLMLDLGMTPDFIPPIYLERNESAGKAYMEYCKDLLSGMKGEVSAVKLNPLMFFLTTEEGSSAFADLIRYASALGYYVLVDFSGLSDPSACSFAAKKYLCKDAIVPCDGVLICAYYGSDIIRSFVPFCEEEKRDLFVQVRSPGKSASELQDLLSGSRTVHLAAADYVNRFGTALGKFGYAGIGVSFSANSADYLNNLRMKYPRLFVIVDGLEYPGANAKNCSFAFDRMGYGAVINMASGVTGAWKESESGPIEAALVEVKNIRRKLERYITIL